MSIILIPSLRPLALAGLAVIGLTAASVAMSDETGALPELNYDEAGQRLLKVERHTLSQSTDQGRSWQVISLPAMAGQASLVTADVPASDGGTLYIAGPGIGVQRSVDEGRTWQPLSAGLPSQDVIAFTIHRNQPETLYAAVAGEGIYQSEDAGQNWQKMDGGPAQPIRRLVHSDMEGSMQTGWLYAVSDDAVRLSMDCFCGWRPGGELGDGQVYDVAYNSEAPKQVFVTTQQGLLHSDNGGRTWQPVPADAAHDAKVAIALTPTGALYALEADGEVRVSMDQGDTWTAPDA